MSKLEKDMARLDKKLHSSGKRTTKGAWHFPLKVQKVGWALRGRYSRHSDAMQPKWKDNATGRKTREMMKKGLL
jgi:hypothetical protein